MELGQIKWSLREITLLQNALFQPQHRPALMLGAAERSPPTMSVHTPPQPPCSWEPSPVAPCLAWPQQVLPLNISVSPLMRFLMMCPCPRGGRWPRLPLARDTSSSKYASDKCRNCFLHFMFPEPWRVCKRERKCFDFFFFLDNIRSKILGICGI